MRVVVTAIGTNHFFHMASQLERLGALEAIFTGYPRFKLRGVGVSPSRIRTFPLFQAPYMAVGRMGVKGGWLERQLCFLANRSLDSYVSKVIPTCEIFIGQSNCSLRTGKRVQARGGFYVCDRPCSHIRHQDELLREEYRLQGVGYTGIDPRILDREEEEYAAADAILVASQFSYRSFINRGFSDSKLWLIPYGVDTSRFLPTGGEKPSCFTVLFVGNASIRKGISYLVDAFRSLPIQDKQLVFAGSILPEVSPILRKANLGSQFQHLGPLPQAELRGVMGRSHVLVLPSIEEGFGMVVPEALATGLPVVTTTHVGAADLLLGSKFSKVVPPRDSNAISTAILEISESAPSQEAVAEDFRRSNGVEIGWSSYGDKLHAKCVEAMRLPLDSSVVPCR